MVKAPDIRSYTDAHSYFTNRNPAWSGRIGHNTYLVSIPEGYGIRYHDTVIVRYARDGAVYLNTGGWRTVTTKARLNQFTPVGLSVYQEKHVWYVWQPRTWPRASLVDFYDGMLARAGTTDGQA